jgi:hypothetical protein
MRVLFSLSLCLLIGSLVSAVSLQGESIVNYAGEISSTGSNTQDNQGNRLQGRGLDTVLPFRKPTLIKIEKRVDIGKLLRDAPEYWIDRYLCNKDKSLSPETLAVIKKNWESCYVLVRTNLMHFLKELSKWLFIHYRYG